MPYTIKALDLFVRQLPPDRMSFSIGKGSGEDQAITAKKRRPSAVILVRLELSDGKKTVVGCSGDRPSFGWLDKRPDRTPEQKLAALLDLVQKAREVYLKQGQSFESPFQLWLTSYREVMDLGKAADQESLMASYASALFERAVIDAVCKAQGLSFFDAVKGDKLGIDAAMVHPELKDFKFTRTFPKKPRKAFGIRHTVGLSDPLVAADLKAEARVNDGEPETLEEYVERDGLEFFKIKISGQPDTDLARLEKIWNQVLVNVKRPVITLDGNEAYQDIDAFGHFVNEMDRHLIGLSQHTVFIEQPLTRALTLDPATSGGVVKISEIKPLVIDEADGTNQAFKQAFGLGYSGTSHKNCKGIFKSLLNRALCVHFIVDTGREAFLTGEDLSNMPIVPLHQDFAVLSTLDIEHCERNGHHYAFGLSHLTDSEKSRVADAHADLYVKRGAEWFLNIKEGEVKAVSLQGPGLGGDTQPDWGALTPLAEWDVS